MCERSLLGIDRDWIARVGHRTRAPQPDKESQQDLEHVIGRLAGADRGGASTPRVHPHGYLTHAQVVVMQDQDGLNLGIIVRVLVCEQLYCAAVVEPEPRSRIAD